MQIREFRGADRRAQHWGRLRKLLPMTAIVASAAALGLALDGGTHHGGGHRAGVFDCCGLTTQAWVAVRPG